MIRQIEIGNCPHCGNPTALIGLELTPGSQLICGTCQLALGGVLSHPLILSTDQGGPEMPMELPEEFLQSTRRLMERMNPPIFFSDE